MNRHLANPRSPQALKRNQRRRMMPVAQIQLLAGVIQTLTHLLLFVAAGVLLALAVIRIS